MGNTEWEAIGFIENNFSQKTVASHSITIE